MGNTVITELLKDGARFTIAAITRSTSSYTPPSTAITHRTVDYTSFSSLQAAFQGQDAVVNCVTGGATHYEPSKLVIDAAVAAGVKFFFANEFVGDITRKEFKRLPEAFRLQVQDPGVSRGIGEGKEDGLVQLEWRAVFRYV